MRTASHVALAAALGLLLAGCGGSGGDEEEERPTFAELEAESEALAAEIEDLEVTDPAALPVEGSATYEGVISVESAEADGFGFVPPMGGELTLDVDFDDSTVSGSAENFVTTDGEEMSGSLDIGNGQVFRDANIEEGQESTFATTLSGQLEDADGGEYSFGGGLAGNFLGTSHSHVGGGLEGVVVTPDGVDVFEGGFVAER